MCRVLRPVWFFYHTIWGAWFRATRLDSRLHFQVTLLINAPPRALSWKRVFQAQFERLESEHMRDFPASGRRAGSAARTAWMPGWSSQMSLPV